MSFRTFWGQEVPKGASGVAVTVRDDVDRLNLSQAS
jgi:hypothetical protein